MDINGILNINKPKDMTSHDVVAIARRALGIKKIGHTGTLDPMATGVLPICIGKATKVIEYMDLDLKTYRCTLIFGVLTDTQDVWGKVLERRSTDGLTSDKISEAVKRFSGIIEQTPPVYSALKVNGRKLYEYARAGEEVEVKKRRIYINSFRVENIDLSHVEKRMTFSVECSKGTYVRTICKDLGDALGCGATLAELERTESGIFDMDNAMDIEVLRSGDESVITRSLYPVEAPLVHFGTIRLDGEWSRKYLMGWKIPWEHCHVEAFPEYADKDFFISVREDYRCTYKVFDMDGVFMGISVHDKRNDRLVADKVIYARKEEQNEKI